MLANGFFPLYCRFWGFMAWEKKGKELQGYPEVFLFTPESTESSAEQQVFSVIFFPLFFSR